MSQSHTTVPDTIQWKRDYLTLHEAIETLQKKRELHQKLTGVLDKAKGYIWEEIMGGISDD